MIKKNFLIIGLFAFVLAGISVSCEKEETKPVQTETEVTFDESEMNKMLEAYDLFKEEFPVEADRKRELQMRMYQFTILDDRSLCLDAAMTYGDEMVEHYIAIGVTGMILDFYDWYFTNQYYERYCVGPDELGEDEFVIIV